MMTRLARLWDNYKYRFVPWIAGDFHRQINGTDSNNVEPVDFRHARQQLMAVVSELPDAHETTLRYGSTGNEKTR